MEGLDELVPRTGAETAPAAYEAVITRGANDPSDEVFVAVEGFDIQQAEPTRFWSPRIEPGSPPAVAYPSRGDRCIVIRTDRDNPVIVEWTPYA